MELYKTAIYIVKIQGLQSNDYQKSIDVMLVTDLSR